MREVIEYLDIDKKRQAFFDRINTRFGSEWDKIRLGLIEYTCAITMIMNLNLSANTLKDIW
jgi:hypothetical protein